MSFYMLTKYWVVQVLTFQMVLALINGALFLDLYLIMRNPFFPSKSREKRYYAVILTLTITYFILMSEHVKLRKLEFDGWQSTW